VDEYGGEEKERGPIINKRSDKVIYIRGLCENPKSVGFTIFPSMTPVVSWIFSAYLTKTLAQ